MIAKSFPTATPGEWDWGSNSNLLPTVAFRGSVAVLTGTLLQVLWTDRTVTSPLDRLTWRKS